MKRILGMVVAIAAVLSYSSAASAALVTFDISGSGMSWTRSTDAAASDPLTAGGVCTPGMLDRPAPIGAGNNCFRYAFAAGSSVTVDIVGSDVTMIGGQINIDTTANPTPLVFGTINLGTNITTTIYGATDTTPAATGTLVGNSILWSTAANVSTAGFLTCAGSNCGAIGMTDGGVTTFEPTFSLISLTDAVTALNLGEWQLNGTNDAILASSNAVARWSQTASVAAYNGRGGVLVFGPTGLGNPVPEPGAAALVLLGLGALAVRSRKA